MFDLSKNNFGAASEEGFEFHVKAPWGEDTDFVIKVRGEYSKTVQSFQKKKYNEFQLKQTAAKRRGNEYEITLEEAEAMSIEAAINRIVSWKGLGQDGKELPFTKETAEMVLKDNSYIVEQITAESKAAINFRPV